ncbi:MAG: rRNA maturation RNase YbeY [Saprospiraceae bacterium]|nr:rRNA maturation RNase YbeY [Saprospiraceae bacterium]
MMDWLAEVAKSEKKHISNLLYIFCTDSFLLDINQRYLNHDTLTDIITFPYNNNPIESEIYVSLERVFENADTFSQGHKLYELARVLVHGLLHMCGYSDNSEEGKRTMRAKESHYLVTIFPAGF